MDRKKLNTDITVTIVTVAYNADKCVETTIKSVLGQTYDKYEYIFVDGQSSDKTFQIAKSYEEKFNEKGILVKSISEKDNGIYDAMNKAIDMASGKWILFMNAGDVFASKNILSKVFSRMLEESSIDVIYGDTVVTQKGFYKLIKASNMSVIYEKMPFCHQSVFVKSDQMKKYKFNLRYRLAADYDFFSKLYIEGGRFKYINDSISIYDMEGLSSKNSKSLEKEYDVIRQKQFGYTNKKINSVIILKVTKIILIKIISLRFPWLYYTKKRGWHKNLQQVQ